MVSKLFEYFSFAGVFRTSCNGQLYVIILMRMCDWVQAGDTFNLTIVWRCGLEIIINNCDYQCKCGFSNYVCYSYIITMDITCWKKYLMGQDA